jgi:hypothetical protein
MKNLIYLRSGVLLTVLALFYLVVPAQDSIFQKMLYDDGAESHIYAGRILPRPGGGIFSQFTTGAFSGYIGFFWRSYNANGILSARAGFNSCYPPSTIPPFSGFYAHYNCIAETDTNKVILVGSYKHAFPAPVIPPNYWAPYIELMTWTGATSTSIVKSLGSVGECTWVHKTPDNHLLIAIKTPSRSLLVKTDMLLNTVWIKKMNLPAYRWRVKTNSAGDIYLIYASTIIKLKPDGTLIWEKTVPGSLQMNLCTATVGWYWPAETASPLPCSPAWTAAAPSCGPRAGA